MEENKIIELSGIADIYVRAICDIENKYHEGDLVASLYDKSVNFNFRVKKSDIERHVDNLLSYYDRNLDSIDISDLSVTEKIMELFQETELTKDFFITQRENKIPYEKEILLNYSAVEGSIYIEGITQESIEYDSINNSIYSTELDDTKYYSVCYKRQVIGNLFSLNKVHNLPYLSLEIHFTGNANKENEKVFFLIPRVKLISTPVLTPPASFEISFKIVHDEEDKIIMGILNG